MGNTCNTHLITIKFQGKWNPSTKRISEDTRVYEDLFYTLTQAFGARFITCSRTPLPLGSLLTLSMREGETLKSYSDRYWEMFKEIGGKNDPMAITTFKAGLPADHDLRKSLTGKPVSSVRQLMDRIEKYKRIEEDQL